MKIKTILITGIAGLIGSNLADWILKYQPGVDVVGIDDLSGGYIENVDSRVAFYKRDLAKDEISDIFETHKPDIVYHFAAYAAEALSPFIRKFNYVNNLVATSAIINECIRFNVARLVFSSSMSVYGRAKPPFDETLPYDPIDPYAVAKMSCEIDIKIAGEQHGLDWCIIRPHNFYGPKQNIWDSYRNVLGIWMYKILTNSPITVFGDGSQIRAFSYVDDSLPCFWKAGFDKNCSKEIINLGGINSISILEAADILVSVTGKGEISYFPPRHEVHHATPTWSKSVKLLDFCHKTDLSEGLNIMWQWAQKQPLRPRQVWSAYELDKGIYPYWNTETLVRQAPTTIRIES